MGGAKTNTADALAALETQHCASAEFSASDDLVVASHDALFVETSSSRCDACSAPLEEDEGVDAHEIRGRGVYLWARGDEIRLESVPLCPRCASAIGMTALARWEIEEEEG